MGTDAESYFIEIKEGCKILDNGALNSWDYKWSSSL
jgi:hypothetical protein